MIRVIVESPFAPSNGRSVEDNLTYLRAAMADCLARGEAPFTSHGLYTQPGVLDDKKPEERKKGIQAGFAWRESAEKTVVYADHGVTPGMQAGVEDAHSKGRPVEWRYLSATSV